MFNLLHFIGLTKILLFVQIVVEGTVFERVFEADPNINYTYSWNKRNVYKQKVSYTKF